MHIKQEYLKNTTVFCRRKMLNPHPSVSLHSDIATLLFPISIIL
jgi:hypothetical protein